MLHFARRSLLVQLLSVYLVFVIVVLIGGVAVNAVVEQQLSTDVQASDEALAQEIALETSLHLRDTEQSLVALGKLALQASTPDAMRSIFRTYHDARSDVDQVSWLDPVGTIQVSWPPGKVNLGAEFSPPGVVRRARTSRGPVFEVGIAEETTFAPDVIIAESVHTPSGKVIIAASLSLAEFSKPVSNVVQAQQRQGRRMMISVIDGQGELVATSDPRRILQTVLDQLPGADQALQGHVVSQVGMGSDGKDWLFSAVAVPDAGWAVVVQRPASEALAVATQFQFWLLAAALLFAIGGLLFWLMLLMRVIRPLHALALRHQALPTSEQFIRDDTTGLGVRD